MNFFQRWFKRWEYRVRFYLLQRNYVKSGNTKPDRQRIANLIALLDPDQFALYKPEYTTGKTLALYHSDIGEITSFINSAFNLLKAGELVPIEFLRNDRKEILIDHWLTVTNGFYGDPVKSLVEFKQASQNLIEICLKYESQSTGVHAASWRQLQPFYYGLQSVLEILHEILHRMLVS